MANQETTTTIYASFYEKTNYGSNAQVPAAGQYLKPLRVRIDESKNEIPSFSAEFSFAGTEYPSNYKWNDFIAKGRRVTFYAYHHYDSPFTQIPLGTFIIDSIEQSAGGSEKTLSISGPGLMQELNDKLLFYPIGVYKTNLAYLSGAAAGPTNTTLSAAAAVGAETVTVTNLTGFGVDDEIRITLDVGGIHVTTLAETEGGIKLATKLPAAANAGNTVQLRKRKITVNSAALFYEGDVIKIQRDHPHTLVHDGYLIEGLEGNVITLSRGMLDSAASGNYVQREDYSEPTANDIGLALAGWNFLTPWSATIQTGRAGKTSLATKGASIFNALTQIADIHGEYFISDCMTTVAAGDPTSLLPKRRIIWRTSCRDSGIKLVQAGTEAEYTAAFADKTKAIILDLAERTPRPTIDTVYVKGAGAGVNQISLADSDQATRDAVLTPNSYVMSGNEGDIYKPFKIVNPAVSAYRETMLNIDVLPEDGSPEATVSAANMMLRQAAAQLKMLSADAREYQVRAIGRVLIRPGDTVELDYTLPDFGIAYTKYPFQVISAGTEVGPDGIFYDLVLSTSLIPNEQAKLTDEAAVTREIIGLQNLRDTFNAPAASGNLRTAAYIGTTLPPTTGGASYIAGDGIAIAANTISVNAPALAGMGLETIDNNFKLRPAVPDSGLNLTASGLALGLPGSIGALTTNAVSGANHSHAVNAYDDMNVHPGHLLKSTGAGEVTVRKATATSELRSPLLTAPGPLQITPAGAMTQTITGAWNVSATADSQFSLGSNRLGLQGHLRFTHASPIIDTGSATPLTLAPTAELNLNPAGDTVFQWGVNSKVRSSTYVSQLQGWALSYGSSGGHLDVRTLFADEFHVKAFIAELEMAFAGGFRITKSRGIVSRPFTLPATTGQTSTVYFHDIPGWEGIAIFDRRQDDIVAMSYVDIGSSMAMGGIVYGVVNRSSYTNYATTREQSWTISWTYLLTGNIAGGKKVVPGTPILDYGLPPNMHFIEANVLDPAASPYLRSVSVETINSTTKQPTAYDVHFQAGALSNLANVGQEYGVFAGRTRTHAHALFTDMRAEIHQASFTLYGNLNSDNLYLRLNAAEVDTSTSTGKAPLTDQAISNVVKTGGTTYESNIDEELNALDSNYIWNTPGQAANARFTLEAVSGTPTTAQVRVNVSSVGTQTYGDDLELRAQLFQANGTTPLTEEIVVARWGASGTITAPFNQIDAGSWSNAQLKFRWVYFPALLTPTIRLDPDIPALAIGNPLPTGFTAGGDGIWAGRDTADGLYKLRIGAAAGVGLRWNGSNLSLTNSTGGDVIRLESTGDSYFTGVMSLGTYGGIWQGTGTFAAPTTGLKIWRDGNVGRLATYSGGTVQVQIDSTGTLLAGGGSVRLNATGLKMEVPPAFNSTAALEFLAVGRIDAQTIPDPMLQKEVRFWVNNAGGSRGATLSLASDQTYAGNSNYANLDAGDIGLTAVRNANVTGATVNLTATGDIALNASANGTNGVIVNTAKTILAQGSYDWDILEMRSSDIAHGMTTVTAGSNFGTLGKNQADSGGLLVRGFSEGAVAMNLAGYATSGNTLSTTAANGAIQLSSFLRSGTGITDMAAGDNLVVIRNNLTTRFIIKGNGNFYYDGTGAAYDDHDDVGLLRALSRETWRGTIDSAWDRFITYNRTHLEEAGILSDGGFINGAALNRLLVGAVWQLHERLAALEQRLAGLSNQSDPVG